MADTLWSAVAPAWPGGDAPQPERVAVEELADALIAQVESSAPPAGGVMLVVLGEDAPRATIVALAHLLRDAVACGFVVSRAIDGELAGEISGGGLRAITPDAPPGVIAAALAALVGRQEAVSVLQRELRILSSFQGGVRQEMDRMHEELNLAAVIQQELLPPSLPEAPGISCGAFFRPASYVSGDIYDITQIGEHRLGFFVADAVGHGVPAALMTMMISRSLRASIAARSPAEAMTSLNADLVRAQRGRSRFATAICGTIDTRTRSVTLCSAGHPPALVFGPGGCREFDSGGALLGVFEGEPYEQASLTLEPGQTLLLYSDGFEMAFPGHDAHQPTRVGTRTYLDEFAALPWDQIAHAPAGVAAALALLEERINCQAGSLHQQDDLTALAIAALPTAAAARSAA